MTIGHRIRQYRQRRGLSQEALAAIAGVTSRTIWQYEADVTSPRIDKLQRIAADARMTVGELIGEQAQELTQQERAVLAALRIHQGN